MELQSKRIVKGLQHVAMSIDFFLVTEDDGASINNDRNKTVHGHGDILANLSRSLWRDFARFIVEEIDNRSTIARTGSAVLDRFDNIEGLQSHATVDLFRLTKHQVQKMIGFNNNHQMSDNAKCSSYLTAGGGSTETCLTEEEISIVITTILRLVVYPNEECWTVPTQEWIANLLQVPILGNKLRMMLQATVVSSSFVPDSADQIRIISGIQEILLSTNKIATETATNTTTSSLATDSYHHAKIGDDRLFEEDPWQSFW